MDQNFIKVFGIIETFFSLEQEGTKPLFVIVSNGTEKTRVFLPDGWVTDLDVMETRMLSLVLQLNLSLSQLWDSDYVNDSVADKDDIETLHTKQKIRFLI